MLNKTTHSADVDNITLLYIDSITTKDTNISYTIFVIE